MKNILIPLIFTLYCFSGNAQTHSDKLQLSKDSSFKAKVIYSAYMAAKNLVSDGEVNDNVRRFSQIIITTINNPDPSITEGLGYYIQSIPETVSITINSTQQNIDFAIPFVFQLFAKAWYKDLR